MITFGDLELQYHEAPLEGPWEVVSQVNTQFGTNGFTNLEGGLVSRTIECGLWVTGGFATKADLYAALEEIDAVTGTTEELTIGTTDYGLCRLDGFRRTRAAFYSSQQASWLSIGTILFTQSRA